VWLINEGGTKVDLLTNEIGSYSGEAAISIHDRSFLAEPPGNYRLEISASGSWTVGISQPNYTSGPGAPHSYNGSGRSVTEPFTLEDGLAIFTLAHDGNSNFIVWLLASDGSNAELLVNEIGPYDGGTSIGVGSPLEPNAGVYILDIEADGNWSVGLEQP
jgi:hypothetical protein